MPSDPRLSPRLAFASALAIGLAVAALGLDRPSPALVDPPVCAGAPEMLAALAARTFDETPVAGVVAAVNGVLLVVAIAVLAWLVWAITQRVAVAAVVAIAAAVTPVLARDPSPGHAAAFGLACVVLALLGPPGRSMGRAMRWPLLVAALALLTAAVPIGCGAASGLPAPLAAGLRAAIAGVGPAALAFAAFGLVAVALDRRWTLIAPSLTLGVLLLLVSGAGAEPARAAAVLSAGVWLSVAFGMTAFLERAGRPASRLGALLLVALVAVLQVARAERPRVEVDPGIDGHLRMTHQDGSRILAALPPGAALADEDALAAVMISSVASSKPVTRVPAMRADVDRALEAGPVYALPRAQRTLQFQGFETTPTGRIGAPGLARVTAGAGCARPDDEWRPWHAPAGTTGVALVATDPAARGPVLIYITADVLPDVRPIDASTVAARGVFIWDYDLSLASDRERLERDSRDDAVGTSWPPDGSRRIKRVEFWRAPGAGRVLALDVDGTIEAAVIRLSPAAAGPAPLLCPTFVTPVEPLVPSADGR